MHFSQHRNANAGQSIIYLLNLWKQSVFIGQVYGKCLFEIQCFLKCILISTLESPTYSIQAAPPFQGFERAS